MASLLGCGCTNLPCRLQALAYRRGSRSLHGRLCRNPAEVPPSIFIENSGVLRAQPESAPCADGAT
eukprot:252100-Lingulodinium_polyedra.AAC.1